MQGMTVEQVIACRGNPVAALLARRIGSVVTWTIRLTLITLTLLAAALFFQYEVENRSNAWSNAETFTVFAMGVMLLAITLIAAVLSAELAWMKRHRISPDLFTDLPEYRSNDSPATWAEVTEATEGLCRVLRRLPEPRGRSYDYAAIRYEVETALRKNTERDKRGENV